MIWFNPGVTGGWGGGGCCANDIEEAGGVSQLILE